jgi:N-acetylneuraminic acid mutarotase
MFSGMVNGHADGWVDWVDKYDPRTDTWEVLADAPRERDHFEAVMVNGNVYLIGGRKTNVWGIFLAEPYQRSYI